MTMLATFCTQAECRRDKEKCLSMYDYFVYEAELLNMVSVETLFKLKSRRLIVVEHLTNFHHQLENLQTETL